MKRHENCSRSGNKQEQRQPSAVGRKDSRSYCSPSTVQRSTQQGPHLWGSIGNLPAESERRLRLAAADQHGAQLVACRRHNSRQAARHVSTAACCSAPPLQPAARPWGACKQLALLPLG